jgi:FkbM family methyltransferase
MDFNKTSFGTYYFYDCGAYGLFTLASERWQPIQIGKRIGQFEKFFGAERPKIVPEENGMWRELGFLLEAIGPKVKILDVGGYIGTFSIPLALSAREKGLDVEIEVFEPGATQEVLAINIDLNGLSDTVRTNWCAISNCDGYAIYRFPANGSIGGNMINSPQEGSLQRIVKTRTIDAVTKDMKGNMLIKLDTQGHEAQIMRHAGAEIERARAVWQIEYLPWSAKTDMGGETFEQFLQRQFHCICDHKVITEDDWDAFSRKADASSARMADLILVPKTASFADAVLARLSR